MKDDVLWMGENKAVVCEVDPIRGLVKVALETDEQVVVRPENLTVRKPKPPRVLQKRKRRQQQAKAAPEPSVPEPVREPVRNQQEPSPARLTSPADVNFEFSVFVKQDGLVFKVGSLCLVDTCSFPFVITRIFKSSVSGTVFISGVRCVCKGEKVVSILRNFQITVECSFVCPCSSSQFCMSNMPGEVSSYAFSAHSRVCVCQERNFENTHYLRELRLHALGAHMRHAVSSGISLNATRPAQPVCLGTLEPFHDMAIFGLSEVNKFRIPFSLASGYGLLDSIMGKGWDLKPLRADVADCHFKFVTSLTVYLDKKNFNIKFSFSQDYREKCKALSQ